MNIDTLLRIKKHTVVRYVAAGGLSFLVEIVSTYSLILLFDFSKTFAVAIAFWIGLLVAFYLQKKFAFSNRSSSKKHVLAQSTTYATLVLVNYVFTLIFVYTFKDGEVFITRAIALAVTTVWNYFIYKYLIFKP